MKRSYSDRVVREEALMRVSLLRGILVVLRRTGTCLVISCLLFAPRIGLYAGETITYQPTGANAAIQADLAFPERPAPGGRFAAVVLLHSAAGWPLRVTESILRDSFWNCGVEDNAFVLLRSAEQGIPAFLSIILIPLTYSITQGIVWGFISYTILKLVAGRRGELHPMMYAITALSVLVLALE